MILEKLQSHYKRLNAHYRRLNVLDNNDRTKILKGFITQAGTAAPTLTILQNTLGEVPVMAYTSAGLYTMTVGEDVFTLAKTVWSGFNPQGATADKAIGVVHTSVNVLTITQAIATVATDVFSATPFYIEVHP